VIAASVLFVVAAGNDEDYFRDRVEPILRNHCVACHNHALDDGDVSFEDRTTLLRDRPKRGPAVVPGDPVRSALVRAIRHDGDVQMPPGKKLARRDIQTLIEWIRRGAPHSAREPK
jgi:hypothetical protein